MSSDVIDEVRRLAPPVEPTSEPGRARQRQKLADAIAEGSGAATGGGMARGRRSCQLPSGRGSRRRVHLVGAAATLVAAVATAIALSLHERSVAPARVPGPSAPVIRLASYRLRLPAGYRLSSAIPPDCHPYLLFRPPTNPWNGRMPAIARYASRVTSGASAAGGCVFMALLPPYAPTATVPDPEEVAFSHPRQVQVGRYTAWTGTSDARDVARGTAEGLVVGKPAGATEVLGNETMLYVEIRLADGQAQDLVVGSSGLSQSKLVSLVARGLSARADSSIGGTHSP